MDLKKKRKENQLRQKDIAQILGTSRVTVSRWERGTITPKLKTIKKLSQLYNCTVDELIK